MLRECLNPKATGASQIPTIRHASSLGFAIDDRIARLTALRGEIARRGDHGTHGATGQGRVIEALADHGLRADPVH